MPMTTADRTARKAYAAGQWVDLRDRLQTVTPQAIGRAIVAVAAVAGAVALTVASWPAAAPFIVGGIVTYELLPVVDALDRVMPRMLAAILSVLAVVATIVAIGILVLPPLANVFVRYAADLPTAADIDAAVARFQQQLATLPDGSTAILVPVLTSLASTVREAFSSATGGLDEIVRTGLGVLLNAVGAFLGLIVLPTWMLALLTQKHRARIAVDNQITPSLRRDAWAAASIVDRAAGSYLRGYVVTAALVGLLVYVGTQLSPRLGGPTFDQPLAVATFAGVTQVVPVVGTILGLIPALLTLPLSPERAGTYLAIYVVARILGSTILGSRLMSRNIGVHPAILVPGVVLIGQFGILWLLLSAPIVAIVVDLVRYIHGRLSEPPRPAGLLPHEPMPVAASARAAGSPGAVPSAYRPGTPPPPIPPRATPPPAVTPAVQP
jgi:predicted PurR-regulated permease PerM